MSNDLPRSVSSWLVSLLFYYGKRTAMKNETGQAVIPACPTKLG